MTKEKKTTKKVVSKPIKKLTFKQELTKSKLSKRISPTTLNAIAGQLDKEAALRQCINLLMPFFQECSIKEFCELTNEIKELNGR
jgi:hypothetical protein